MAFSQVVALIHITANPLLVAPVSSQAMLSNEVHLGGPNLDLHWDSIIPSHDGVEGTVAIGLGVLNVVLEAPFYWLPQLVHLQCEERLRGCVGGN